MGGGVGVDEEGMIGVPPPPGFFLFVPAEADPPPPAPTLDLLDEVVGGFLCLPAETLFALPGFSHPFPFPDALELAIETELPPASSSPPVIEPLRPLDPSAQANIALTRLSKSLTPRALERDRRDRVDGPLRVPAVRGELASVR